MPSSFQQPISSRPTSAVLPPLTEVKDASGVTWHAVDGARYMTTTASGVQIYKDLDELHSEE